MSCENKDAKKLVEQYLNAEIIKGASTCFVHFSSRNKPKGRFDKYPVPEGVSNIYLNSCAKDWYVNGLPCWGEDLATSVMRLQELISSAEAKKVVFIGSSMGAFGAALFASHIRADLICFAPELYLNVYSGFSKSDNLPGNLPRLECKDAPGRVLIFAGVNAPSDVVCAKYFQKHWPNCQSYFLENCGHGTARHLKNFGLLDKVISEFICDRDVSSLVEKILVPNDFFLDVNFVEPYSFSKIYLDNYIESVYGKFKLHDVLEICGHLRARGAFEPALKLIEQVISDHGPIADAVLLKAQCLRRMRRDQEAIDAFSTLEIHPEYKKQSYLGRALVYKKLGQIAEVRDCYSQLVADVKKELDQYLPLLNECIAALQSQTVPVISPHIGTDGLTEIAKEIEISSTEQNEKFEEAKYVSLISKCLEESNFEKATSFAVNGIKHYPQSLAIFDKYASIAQKQKNWSSAADRLSILLNLEGEHRTAESYARLVQAWRNAKQFERAEAIALEGLNAFPGSSTIQSEYAWTAQTLKNWPESVRRLEKLNTMLGAGASRRSQERLAEARRNLRQIEDLKAFNRGHSQ